MRLGGTAAAALTALVLAAAACGTQVETAKGPPPTSAPTGAISPGPPPTGAPATERAATPLPAETVTPPSPAGDIEEEPSLLGVLPADLGGIPVAHEPQAFIDAAADAAFAQNAEAAAFAVVVDADDLASAVVARLNPDVYSGGFFRDWRDSYNDGACAQSGGVVGNAESVFGEQTVYIGTCAGGLRTYHTWIEDRGLLISAFSMGDRRFGELLMAGLRP
ncbi:MAG TPA: hypothetical protein VES19_08270 [Candidatus Limnocylindrales bacterium]|nr:hypothetical protein [Candidatus Limnocylindrales bacterium]